MLRSVGTISQLHFVARRYHGRDGNCGVGIAPCKPAGAARWRRGDLVNVEADSVRGAGKRISWEWETFSRNSSQRRDVAARGINLAFPRSTYSISALTCWATESMEREATPVETTQVPGFCAERWTRAPSDFPRRRCRNISATRDVRWRAGWHRPTTEGLRQRAARRGRGAIEIALTRRAGPHCRRKKRMLDSCSTRAWRR